MKRKFIKSSLCLSLILSAVILASCGNNSTSVTTSEAQIKSTDWKITKSASCTEPGIRQRVNALGETITEEIAATGHIIVTQEAIEATCTSDGSTAGTYCSACGEVFEESKTIPAHHTVATKKGEAAECIWAGRSDSSYCTVCGEVIKEETKIHPIGHNFVNGVCKNCGEKKPDYAGQIVVNSLKSDNGVSFITKKAYAGGSTISFSAYVPSGSTWWGVCYTDDLSKADNYLFASNSSYGVFMTTKTTDAWDTYTVTLPDTDKKYYIYFAAAIGEWNGNLVIDDIVITDKSGKTLATEDFANGVENSIFTICEGGEAGFTNKELCKTHTLKKISGYEATCLNDGLTDGYICTTCKKTVTPQTVIKASGHKLNDAGECSVCGLKLGDSAVAIYPNNLISDGNTANLITTNTYPGGSVVKFKVYVPENVPNGTWLSVSYTTDKYSCDVYSNWLGGGYIEVNDSTKGEWVDYKFTLPDDDNQYYIYFAGAIGEWSDSQGNALYYQMDEFSVLDKNNVYLVNDTFDFGFTSSEYPSAFTVNSGTNAIEIMAVEGSCANGHTLVKKNAIAGDCTTDSETESIYCSVCGEIIKAPVVTPASGHTWNYETGKCFTCGESVDDNAATVYPNLLSDNKPNMITKVAYPAGSTITFKLYIYKDTPTGTWLGVNYTDDLNNYNIYSNWLGGGGISVTADNRGKWVDCTLTLPTTGGPYYIFFAGAIGEWKTADKTATSYQIDDVVITDANGNVLGSDNFDYGFNDTVKPSLFNIYKNNSGDEAVKLLYHGYCKSHIIVVDSAITPTCTTTGLTEGSHCALCGEIIEAQEVLPATGHNYENGVCINCGEDEPNVDMYLQAELKKTSSPLNKGEISFISKQSYSVGTTVTIEAKVDSAITSWGFAFSSDVPDVVTNFDIATNGVDLKDSANNGVWATYTFTVSGDDPNKKYYFYLCGNTSSTSKKYILIDNVVITEGSVTYTDTFNNGSALFNVSSSISEKEKQ